MKWYSFEVNGSYQNGHKVTMKGHIQDEDGYPFSAFDKAVQACQDLTPGLLVERSLPGSVILKKLKGNPKFYSIAVLHK